MLGLTGTRQVSFSWRMRSSTTLMVTPPGWQPRRRSRTNCTTRSLLIVDSQCLDDKVRIPKRTYRLTTIDGRLGSIVGVFPCVAKAPHRLVDLVTHRARPVLIMEPERPPVAAP